MRGLVVGRFQPFHKGHLAVLKEVLGKCDELVVLIGSAQESHTERNPFTAGERYLMITSSITQEMRSRTSIIPVPDVNRYSIWVAHVESYVPPFDVVYSNSPLTTHLFERAGYRVRRTKEYRPKLYSATAIRKRIARGEKWQGLVPEAVARIIEGVGAAERLKVAGDEPGTRGRKRCAGA